MYGGEDDHDTDGEEALPTPATTPETMPNDKPEETGDFDIPVPVLETKPATESVNTDSVTVNVTAPKQIARPTTKADSLKNDADTLKSDSATGSQTGAATCAETKGQKAASKDSCPQTSAQDTETSRLSARK